MQTCASVAVVIYIANELATVFRVSRGSETETGRTREGDSKR